MFRDVGVSGSTGTASRRGWRALDERLVQGDVLIVAALDRIGRRWVETTTALGELRRRGVMVRSLSPSEEWAVSLAADPETPQGFVANILVQALTWAAQQEAQVISQRTRAGLDRARAEGKRLGRPPTCTEDQIAAMKALRAQGQSQRSIARQFNVPLTVARRVLADGH